MESLLYTVHTKNGNSPCNSDTTTTRMKFIGLIKRRSCKLCCFAAAVVIVLYLSLHLITDDVTNTDSSTLYSLSSHNSSTTKIVLLWNAFFSDPTWNLKNNTRTFHISDSRECIFTNKRDLLPSIENFTAIVFHTAVKFLDVPKKRDVRQQYIFANKESPAHTKHELSNEADFYNMTMTYRLDSDVRWPYNNIRDIQTNLYVAPAEHPSWRTPDFVNFVPDKNLASLIIGKTKSIAWFVSNCNTISKRENLVDKLKNLIDVDIFGACGNLGCPYETKRCDQLLDQQYKFYLSFENSLCIDYVTEKFFNALQRTIIPIVYGGADYNRFAPPHSYINAQDFKNAQDLANYLKYLEKNTTAYGEYFWWKSFYKIGYYDQFPIVFQDLCHYLHKSSVENRVQYYEDIQEHWFNACYTKARIKF